MNIATKAFACKHLRKYFQIKEQNFNKRYTKQNAEEEENTNNKIMETT
jgi:hypothetical protein